MLNLRVGVIEHAHEHRGHGNMRTSAISQRPVNAQEVTPCALATAARPASSSSHVIAAGVGVAHSPQVLGQYVFSGAIWSGGAQPPTTQANTG